MPIINSDSNEMIADLIEKSKVLSNKGKNIWIRKTTKKSIKVRFRTHRNNTSIKLDFEKPEKVIRIFEIME